MFGFLKSLYKNTSASTTNRKSVGRKPPRRTSRLEVELLEDRWMPSVSARPHFIIHPSGGLSPNASGPKGYTPAQIRHAYGVDLITFGKIIGDGSGQTIAIVDAYDDPKFVNSTDPGFVNSDLHKFDQQFGLADPPSFKKVSQTGSTTSLPGRDPAGPGNPKGTWELEEALDVEWVHALAPGANILLVEANDPSSLFTAVNFAKQQTGVSVVSMSFGAPEFSGETGLDSIFTTPSGHGGVTFLASTGDSGAPGGYPAWSPNVVAVGGTSLTLNGNNYVSESGWKLGGGGISQVELQPAYQKGVVTQTSTRRAIPDVSFDADSNTGVAIFDSYDGGSSPWYQLGGTSLSAPCFAGLIAIVNQGRAQAGLSSLDGASQTLPMLYALPAGDFHDITTGNNGFAAGVGYDLVTGRGTPIANLLVRDLVSNNGGGGGGGGSGSITYQLTGGGNLLAIQNGVSTVIDTNVQTFGVTSSGALFDLTNAGIFRQRTGSSWTQLDTKVQWICVGASGSLYELQKGGALWVSTVGSSWRQLDTQVESISLVGGALFDLEQSGNLLEYVNNGWQKIDSGVAQFAATPNGAIYDLQRGGTLYAANSVGASWHVMDTNVQSIATTPDGALFDLERNGILREYVNSGWSSIDSNVRSFWATADGAIYDLQNGGNLYGASSTGASWTKLDSGVTTFYATLGGQLYELRGNGQLWVNTTGSWFLSDSNVRTMYVTYNGYVYDLQQGGNLWADQGNGWFKMDSGVKQFAANYWGWLYDLQNGGNFYANYTGSWSLVHAKVSSFVLNPDGSATYYY